MCDTCEFDEHLKQIDYLLSVPHRKESRDILLSIRTWVAAHKHATDPQIEVIEKKMKAALRI